MQDPNECSRSAARTLGEIRLGCSQRLEDLEGYVFTKPKRLASARHSPTTVPGRRAVRTGK